MSTNNTMTVMVNPYRRDLNRVWAVKIDDTSFPYAVYPSGHFAPETEVRHWRVVEVPIPDGPFKDGDVVNSVRYRFVRIGSEWLNPDGRYGDNYLDDEQVTNRGYTYLGNIYDMDTA